MDQFFQLIAALIASGLLTTLLTSYLNKRKNHIEADNMQADITKKVQESLLEAIDIYENRIDRYESRIAELETCVENLEASAAEKEKTVRDLTRKVAELDRMFESVLAGAWSLYHQVKNLGSVPIYTPPKNLVKEG